MFKSRKKIKEQRISEKWPNSQIKLKPKKKNWKMETSQFWNIKLYNLKGIEIISSFFQFLKINHLNILGTYSILVLSLYNLIFVLSISKERDSLSRNSNRF